MAGHVDLSINLDDKNFESTLDTASNKVEALKNKLQENATLFDPENTGIMNETLGYLEELFKAIKLESNQVGKDFADSFHTAIKASFSSELSQLHQIETLVDKISRKKKVTQQYSDNIRTLHSDVNYSYGDTYDLLENALSARKTVSKGGLRSSQIYSLMPSLARIVSAKAGGYTGKSKSDIESLSLSIAQDPVFMSEVNKNLNGANLDQTDYATLARAVLSYYSGGKLAQSSASKLRRAHIYQTKTPSMSHSSEAIPDEFRNIFRTGGYNFEEIVAANGSKTKQIKYTDYTKSSFSGNTISNAARQALADQVFKYGNETAIEILRRSGALSVKDRRMKLAANIPTEVWDYIAGNAAKYAFRGKASNAMYYADPNDLEAQYKLLGRENNTYLGAMSLMGSMIDSGQSVSGANAGIILPSGWNAGKFGKETKFIHSGRKQQMQIIIPQTVFDAVTKKLIERSPKDKSVYTGYNEYASQFNPFVAISNSPLLRALGITIDDNGNEIIDNHNTYGFGYNEATGEAKWGKPKLVKINFGDLMRRNSKTQRMEWDTEGHGEEINALNKLRYADNPSDRYISYGGSKYVFAGQDNSGVYIVPEEEKERINKKYRVLGKNAFDLMINNSFDPFEGKQGLEIESAITGKSIRELLTRRYDVSKKSRSPGDSYEHMFGRKSPVITGVDFGAWYDYLGVPPNDPITRTGNRFDGSVFSRGDASGVDYQGRLFDFAKFYSQKMDWVNILSNPSVAGIFSNLLGVDTKNPGGIFNTILNGIKSGDKAFNIYKGMFYEDAHRHAYLPAPGTTKDEYASSLQKLYSLEQELRSNDRKRSVDDINKERQDIIDRYLVDLFGRTSIIKDDGTIDDRAYAELMLTDSAIKVPGGGRYVKKDLFEPGGLFEHQDIDSELNPANADFVKNGYVRLTAKQQMQYINKISDLTGGINVMKTAKDMTYDNDFISKQMVQSWGPAADLLMKESNANYNREFERLRSRDPYTMRKLLMGNARGRQLLAEDPEGWRYNDLVDRLAESQILTLMDKQKENQLYLPGKLRGATIGILPGEPFAVGFRNNEDINFLASTKPEYSWMFSNPDPQKNEVVYGKSNIQSGRNTLFERFPASPGAYTFSKIKSGKDVSRKLRKHGYDPYTAYMSHQQAMQQNTGDEDGDTTWMFSGVKGMDYDAFVKSLEFQQTQMGKAQQILKANLDNRKKNPIENITTPSEVYNTAILNDINKGLIMGATQGVIRNAIEKIPLDDSSRWNKIAEAVWKYDLASSEFWKKGTAVDLSQEDLEILGMGTSIDRFMTQISDYENDREAANPYLKNGTIDLNKFVKDHPVDIFKASLPTDVNAAQLTAFAEIFKTYKKTGITNSSTFEKGIAQAIEDVYDTQNRSGEEKEAAEWYANIIKNFTSGKKVWSAKDLSEGQLLLQRWNASIGINNIEGTDEYKEELSRYNRFKKRLEDLGSNYFYGNNLKNRIATLNVKKDKLMKRAQNGVLNDEDKQIYDSYDSQIQVLSMFADMPELQFLDSPDMELELENKKTLEERKELIEKKKKELKENLDKYSGDEGKQRFIKEKGYYSAQKKIRLNWSDTSSWLKYMDILNQQSGGNPLEIDNISKIDLYGAQKDQLVPRVEFKPYSNAAGGYSSDEFKIAKDLEENARQEMTSDRPYVINMAAGKIRHGIMENALKQYTTTGKYDLKDITESLIGDSSPKDFTRDTGIKIGSDGRISIDPSAAEKKGMWSDKDSIDVIKKGLQNALFGEDGVDYSNGTLSKILGHITQNDIVAIEGRLYDRADDGTYKAREMHGEYGSTGSRGGIKIQFKDKDGNPYKQYNDIGTNGTDNYSTFAPDIIFKNKNGEYTMGDYKTGENGVYDSLFQMYTYINDLAQKAEEEKISNSKVKKESEKTNLFQEFGKVDGKSPFKYLEGYDTTSGMMYRVEYNQSIADQINELNHRAYEYKLKMASDFDAGNFSPDNPYYNAFVEDYRKILGQQFDVNAHNDNTALDRLPGKLAQLADLINGSGLDALKGFDLFNGMSKDFGIENFKANMSKLGELKKTLGSLKTFDTYGIPGRDPFSELEETKNEILSGSGISDIMNSLNDRMKEMDSSTPEYKELKNILDYLGNFKEQINNLDIRGTSIDYATIGAEKLGRSINSRLFGAKQSGTLSTFNEIMKDIESREATAESWKKIKDKDGNYIYDSKTQTWTNKDYEKQYNQSKEATFNARETLWNGTTVALQNEDRINQTKFAKFFNADINPIDKFQNAVDEKNEELIKMIAQQTAYETQLDELIEGYRKKNTNQGVISEKDQAIIDELTKLKDSTASRRATAQTALDSNFSIQEIEKGMGLFIDLKPGENYTKTKLDEAISGREVSIAHIKDRLAKMPETAKYSSVSNEIISRYLHNYSPDTDFFPAEILYGDSATTASEDYYKKSVETQYNGLIGIADSFKYNIKPEDANDLKTLYNEIENLKTEKNNLLSAVGTDLYDSVKEKVDEHLKNIKDLITKMNPTYSSQANSEKYNSELQVQSSILNSLNTERSMIDNSAMSAINSQLTGKSPTFQASKESALAQLIKSRNEFAFSKYGPGKAMYDFIEKYNDESLMNVVSEKFNRQQNLSEKQLLSQNMASVSMLSSYLGIPGSNLLNRASRIGQMRTGLETSLQTKKDTIDVYDRSIEEENKKIEKARQDFADYDAIINDNRFTDEEKKDAETLKQDASARILSSQAEIDRLNSRKKAISSFANIDAGILKITDNPLKAAGIQTLGNTISKISRLASQAINRLIMKMYQYAVQSIQEFDKEMTNIQIVTLKSDSEMNTVKQYTYDTAKKLGASVATVSGVEESLYRQGLSDSQVQSRTETAVKLSNVTGISTDSAVKALTVALNNGLVNSAEEAADALSALGDAAATTAEEIMKGVNKSASAAANAGVSYAELTAMITAIQSKTQIGGNQIGTALKTMFSRITRVTNPDEVVTDENGEIISFNDVSEALSRVGISSTTDTGDIRSATDILSDLASVWEDLTDLQKNNIAYQMGGARQNNTFYSLMDALGENGGEEFQEYLDTVADSAGTLDEKQAVYADSLAASINNLKTAWNEFVNDANGGGIVKIFVDFATSIVSLNSALGALPAILAVVGAALVSFAVKAAAFSVASKGLAGITSVIGAIAAIGAGTLVTGIGLGAVEAVTSSTSTGEAEPSTSELSSEYKSKKDKYADAISYLNSQKDIGLNWENEDKIEKALIDLAPISEKACDALKDLNNSIDEIPKITEEASNNLDEFSKEQKEKIIKNSKYDFKEMENQTSIDDLLEYYGYTKVLDKPVSEYTKEEIDEAKNSEDFSNGYFIYGVFGNKGENISLYENPYGETIAVPSQRDYEPQGAVFAHVIGAKTQTTYSDADGTIDDFSIDYSTANFGKEYLQKQWESYITDLFSNSYGTVISSVFGSDESIIDAITRSFMNEYSIDDEISGQTISDFLSELFEQFSIGDFESNLDNFVAASSETGDYKYKIKIGNKTYYTKDKSYSSSNKYYMPNENGDGFDEESVSISQSDFYNGLQHNTEESETYVYDDLESYGKGTTIEGKDRNFDTEYEEILDYAKKATSYKDLVSYVGRNFGNLDSLLENNETLKEINTDLANGGGKYTYEDFVAELYNQVIDNYIGDTSKALDVAEVEYKVTVATSGIENLEYLQETLEGTKEILENITKGGLLNIKANIELQSNIKNAKDLSAAVTAVQNGTYTNDQLDLFLSTFGIDNYDTYLANKGYYDTESTSYSNELTKETNAQYELIKDRLWQEYLSALSDYNQAARRGADGTEIIELENAVDEAYKNYDDFIENTPSDLIYITSNPYETDENKFTSAQKLSIAKQVLSGNYNMSDEDYDLWNESAEEFESVKAFNEMRKSMSEEDFKSWYNSEEGQNLYEQARQEIEESALYNELTAQEKQVLKYDVELEIRTKGAESIKKASDNLKTLNQSMSAVFNNQFYREAFRNGARDDTTLSAVGSLLGYTEEQMKDAAIQNAALQQLDLSESADIAEVDSYLNATFAKYSDDLTLDDIKIAMPGIEILDDGSARMTLNDVVNNFGTLIDSVDMAYIQLLASKGVEASAIIKMGENADGTPNVSIDWSTTKLGGGYKTSSSGSGGKSSAEKLIEKWERIIKVNDHRINIIQSQEERFDQKGDYASELSLLDDERVEQQKYIEEQQAAMAAYKKLMDKTTQGSDDWYKLRDAYFSACEAVEKAEAAVEKLDDKEKELLSNQRNTRITLEDNLRSLYEEEKQTQRDMLSASVDMQNTILDAIKQRYQDEWDLIKKDIDKKKEALEDEKEMISERLNARKSASDEAEKIDELNEYKSQLAQIEMDPTRTKDAKELKEKIDELEEELYWTKAEEQADYQQEQLQDQIDALDEYEYLGDETLEEYLENANNFADEVNAIMQKSQEEMFDWLKANSEDYKNSLLDTQQQTVNGWEDTYKQMLNITDTYYDQIKDVLSTGNVADYVSEMMQTEEFKNATPTKQAELIQKYYDDYDAYLNAFENSKFKNSESDYGEYMESFMNTIYSSDAYKDATDAEREAMIADAQSNWATMKDLLAGTATFDHDDEGLSTDAGTGKTSSGGSSGGSGSTTSSNKSDLTIAYADWEAASNKYKSLLNGDEMYGLIEWAKEHNIDYYSVGKIIQDGVNEDYAEYVSSVNSAKNLANKYYDSFYDKASNYGLSDYAKQYALTKYKTGGLVDYTGPAWVDGTSSAPEAFLSAQDTKLMRSLLDAANLLMFNPFTSMIDSSAFCGDSNNIGEVTITINQASLDNDADIEEVAAKVGDAFVKQLSINGFNTTKYSF